MIDNLMNSDNDQNGDDGQNSNPNNKISVKTMVYKGQKYSEEFGAMIRE